MYEHEWCRTTSQIPGYKYICLKCAKRLDEKTFDQDCKFDSRSSAEKFKHTWNEKNICIKCGAKKFSVTHTFYKVGKWHKSFTRIEPCKYTDNDWDIKEIIE